MKILSLIMLIAGFSLNAQASFFQEYCNNAEGTLQISAGHNDNFTRATKRQWNGAEYKDTIVELSYPDFEITSSEEQGIAQEQFNSCQPGDEYGWAGGSDTTVKKVRIVKADGSTFDEDFLNRTKDGMALETYLICEMQWNNTIICEE